MDPQIISKGLKLTQFNPLVIRACSKNGELTHRSRQREGCAARLCDDPRCPARAAPSPALLCACISLQSLHMQCHCSARNAKNLQSCKQDEPAICLICAPLALSCSICFLLTCVCHSAGQLQCWAGCAQASWLCTAGMVPAP